MGNPAKAAWIIRILNSSRAEKKFNMQNSAFFNSVEKKCRFDFNVSLMPYCEQKTFTRQEVKAMHPFCTVSDGYSKLEVFN